jgi:hypothetical protein
MEEYVKNVKNSKEYFTVSKYFWFLEKEYGIKSPKINERKNIYQGIELKCASICDERNIMVEKETHLELGSLNKYPEYVLAEVFLVKDMDNSSHFILLILLYDIQVFL